jgi:hypothetical protein
MAGVDAWDLARDARLYDGPHPVVAHPPCGPWSKLRHMYRGAEHDCAPRALEQVRRFGGVLEHPADSKLWKRYRLPMPHEGSDPYGYTIEVDQVRWGHVARKRTWLYLVRVRSLGELPPARKPTHWCSGSKRAVRPIPAGIKAASKEQIRRTPPAFAAWLVSLARSVHA